MGYCYAGPYQARSAYRFTVSDSIYIDERFLTKGIGSALLGDDRADLPAGPPTGYLPPADQMGS